MFCVTSIHNHSVLHGPAAPISWKKLMSSPKVQEHKSYITLKKKPWILEVWRGSNEVMSSKQFIIARSVQKYLLSTKNIGIFN